jgi:hypothetical protein
MANRFLNVNGSGGSNLNDGTTPIFASTLGAASLTASTALKTDANGLLTSTPLDIADVTGLASDLVLKNELSFNEDDTHDTPPANQVKIYVKTDGKLYTKNDAGTEEEVGGGASFLPLTGGTLTGTTRVESTGASYFETESIFNGSSLGKAQLRYNYLYFYSSDGTGNQLGYISNQSFGFTYNHANATGYGHRFNVGGINKVQIDVDGLVIQSTGSLGLEPRTTAPTNFTGTSTELYCDGTADDHLTYQVGTQQHKIAGDGLITVKEDYRFNSNLNTTVYTDDEIEFIWDATNKQMTFKPLTFPNSYVDANMLLVQGNAGGVLNDSGDISFTNNSTYHFSDDGSVDVANNMSNYGARCWYCVCAEASVAETAPCYRIDVMIGNTSYINVTIEKQNSVGT